MIAVLFATGTSVDSANNKTSCDETTNNTSCEQDIWRSSELSSMFCGLTTPYDNCKQLCYDSQCDAIECRAPLKCDQSCYESHGCGSMTCDSKKCDQYCYPGVCNSMSCPNTVENCEQRTARRMVCEADVCEQSCGYMYGTNKCHMTCRTGENACGQFGLTSSNALMECDRGVCDQQCGFGGQCNMTCSSSATPGRCKQQCSWANCESMVCNATNCTQNCLFGECDMTCPLGVKTCTQNAYQDRGINMRCDGEVCKQICSNTGGNGNCNMTCSKSVKECHQTCKEGSQCVFKCDAEKCKVEDCSKPSSCATVKPTNSSTNATINPTTSGKKGVRGAVPPLEIHFSVFALFILLLIVTV